ncbi:hypothetical protein HN51_060958 [Arachis hypogaea]|uniref:uncharacterized protein LOC110268565 isoform X1 n=1 Tax=Arachis ipaensis TaxID=130454 RepID=UPI000A2B5F01|nr:uncharacterized protein LOC110268565 isoform X1 [Arachis ipaensis]
MPLSQFLWSPTFGWIPNWAYFGRETTERKPFMDTQSETRKLGQDIFKGRHRARAQVKLNSTVSSSSISNKTTIETWNLEGFILKIMHLKLSTFPGPWCVTKKQFRQKPRLNLIWCFTQLI